MVSETSKKTSGTILVYCIRQYGRHIQHKHVNGYIISFIHWKSTAYSLPGLRGCWKGISRYIRYTCIRWYYGLLLGIYEYIMEE